MPIRLQAPTCRESWPWATAAQSVYWASQGYACISINWGGNPLTDLAGGSTLPNTDWDGLAAGFVRDGVTHAIHRESTSPASFVDGMTLFAETHPFNNSYCLYYYAARRAMTYLAAQPNVNATKLGITGHSMGGIITVMTGTDPRATCITPSVGGVVAAQESYWPEIQCPTLFLEASNTKAPRASSWEWIESKASLADPEWTVRQTGIPGVSPECTGSIPMTGATGFVRIAVE